MKVVFDLDYTLLDTTEFKKALAATVVAERGPTPEEYGAAYEAVGEKKGMFDPDDLFMELRAKFSDDASAARARERFDAVLATTEKYLYPGARELLEALGKHEDAKVELMTFGNAEWQRLKVENSGLHELFRDIIYTEKDKKEVVRGLGADGAKVIIVNDNGKEMAEMIAVSPEYAYILKKGPKPVPEGLLLPTAESIEALAEFLERETGWGLRREMREAREVAEARVVPPEGTLRGVADVGPTKAADAEATENKEPPGSSRPAARL